MIRSLNFKEYTELYRERVTADFPRLERRPLYIVKKMYRQSRYVCLVLEENGCIAAYATFIYDKNIKTVFLDLFAVNKSQRGCGIGSLFIPILKEYWKDKQGIVLECEKPDAAKNKDEQTLRERRISFYTRLGAKVMPIQWRAFGVEYNILRIPIQNGTDEKSIDNDLLALYRFSLPRVLAKLFVKLRS